MSAIDYGFSTYADFNRACKEFAELLPSCETVDEVEGLRKGLGLAYLSFQESNPAERIMAAGRLKWLMRDSLRKECAIEARDGGAA